MFCGYRHLKVDHGKKVYASGKVYINGLEGFRSFAKERLIKHHGVSRTWFPYYLKELEFRYNNRRNEIFNILCQFACDFIPLVPDGEYSPRFLVRQLGILTFGLMIGIILL